MTTDVGTTPRKPLTPSQRLKLFESFGGICVLCKAPIRSGDKWIDEHLTALGLGGSNDLDNRGIAHETCAHMKTHGPDGDLARIAKAKRSKQAHLGIKRARTGLEGRDRETKETARRARAGDRIPVPSVRLLTGFEPASSRKATP